MKSLNHIKLILGSQSPRRHELIKSLGLLTEIRILSIDEKFPADIPKRDVPAYLANLKSEPFEGSLLENEILVTVDTMVLLENEIIGKPKDLDDALLILQKLNGKKHEVITGVCIKSLDKKILISEYFL